MSDQLTQCPHCQTSFRVTPGQLKSAGGLVRCGSCLGLFSAAINFIRVKPDADDDSAVADADDGLESSDDILLGDLDLDSFPAIEEDLEAALATDDALENADDILLTDLVRVRPSQGDEYELYEEYEEAPDLLADLATAPSAITEASDAIAPEHFDLTPDNAPDPEPAVASTAPMASASAVPDEDELDWLDGPSEEFRPRTILFDDDDEDEGEDDDEEYADENDDAYEVHDNSSTFANTTDLADDYPYETLSEGRAASLDRGGPVLGELDADEFDTPELSELELDELLQDQDDTDTSDFDDSDDLDDAEHAEEFHKEYDEEDDAEHDAEAILDEYMDEIRLDAGERISAIDDISSTAASKGKPDWLQRRDPPPPEKAALHDYLATLEDEDELEPLGADRLDEFDDEPVLLAEDRRSRGPLATTGLALLSLLLIGTLLLQFVDQHLEALRQRNSFARFEPWFCAILDCPPPAAPVTASSSLYSQELLIRSHPRLKGALELSFIFRNDADTAQPFPGLELSFKDPANTLLANRLLLPADYLPAELKPLTAMPAHSSVQVMLELVDPGAEAVNYTIAFRDL